MKPQAHDLPVCLITGAGGLLGAALCRALSPEFSIVAAYRRRPAQIQASLPDGLSIGQRLPSIAVSADLTTNDGIEAIIDSAKKAYGTIDCVVNCAADIAFHGNLLDAQGLATVAHDQFSINCIAPMLLISAVHHNFWKDSSPGDNRFNRSVVNVSSVSGLYASKPAGQAFYAASKAALNMLTLHLALELAPYGIRANSVCPSKIFEGEYLRTVCGTIRDLLTGTTNAAIVAQSMKIT